MSDRVPARPPQVTMAGWVTMLGSLFLVLSVFEVVAGLGSLDTRESVSAAIDDPPLSGLGIDVEQALGLLHVVSVVAGACATAAVVLGWQVLRRNRTARLVLSVVAVPLFLAGLVTGGFLSSMVAVSAMILWTRPARDWFDGVVRPAEPAERPWPASGTRDADRATPPSGPAGPTGPGPDAGPTPAQDAGPPPAQGAGPSSYAGFGAPHTRGPERPRFHAGPPREVVQACIVTWVFATVVALVMVGALVAFVGQPALVEEIHAGDERIAESGVSVDTLRKVGTAMAAGFLVWSLAAVGLAALVYRRSNAARVALVVSAAVAGMLGLAMVVTAPALLLLTLACGVTILLLSRPASADWFARRP